MKIGKCANSFPPAKEIHHCPSYDNFDLPLKWTRHFPADRTIKRRVLLFIYTRGKLLLSLDLPFDYLHRFV